MTCITWENNFVLCSVPQSDSTQHGRAVETIEMMTTSMNKHRYMLCFASIPNDYIICKELIDSCIPSYEINYSERSPNNSKVLSVFCL